MEWESITERIEKDNHGKWDLRAQGKDLRLDSDGSLVIQRNGEVQKYTLSDFAVGQLRQRLSIPARYFKRLPTNMQSELANYDLNGLPDAGFFVRGKSETIRAVLSERYVPYNNREVIESSSVRGQGWRARGAQFRTRRPRDV